MKTCFKCGISKSRAEFYKHPRMADGLLGKCKSCTKTDVTLHRLENLDAIREYDRRRSNEPHRIEKNRRIAAEYIERYPERRKANYMVNNAVRDKRLVKWPCQVCGNPKSVGHHPDYSRPLDVVWLCQPHHKQAHALVRSAP